MKIFIHRFFWSLVILLQIMATALNFHPDAPAESMALLVLVFRAGFIASALGVAFQKRFYKHNFWAGFFGICVAASLLSILGLLSQLTLGSFLESGYLLGFTLLRFVALFTGLFAIFVYVYGSPSIWFEPAKSTASQID